MMTLDFNERQPVQIPDVSLRPYDWCKHHFMILTRTGDEGAQRYRMRCPMCLMPEKHGHTGVGVAKARQQWGNTQVDYALDFDFLSNLSLSGRLSVVRKTVFRVNYFEYMGSDKWREKRAAVLERTEGLCERCGAPAEHIHHKSYENLGKEPLADLEALCRPCHFQEHGRIF